MMHFKRYRRELTFMSHELNCFYFNEYSHYLSGSSEQWMNGVVMAPAVMPVTISCTSVISQVFILLTPSCV